MHVVATAGHVDHGKSTLVRALTGQDPDRLEEERRRGLSIQLGYCWTTLDPVGDVAFVDVPGHERFVTTTLAGLGPVPVALLVVAADDPWMPQAAEHLAALDGLGVEHGVVAVTRSDLADPAAVAARARAEVDATSLRGAPVLPVSGRTGAGLPALRSELARLLGALPDPDPAAPVRLWVDRAFHVRGTGTVATGTLPAGTVRPGDVLVLADGGAVRVRSVQSLGRDVAEARGVARVALALAGRAAGRVHRGDVLVGPDAFVHTRVVDVALTTGPGDAGTLPERPLLHVGATSLAVHARPLGPGTSAGGRTDGRRLARLTLERELPLRPGDRAVLRDPGDRRTWGVRVLDPAPPPLARRGAAAQRAAALTGAGAGAGEGARGAAVGTVAAEVERRGLVDRALLGRLGATGPAPADAVDAGAWLVSGAQAARLAARLSAYAVERSDPERPGVALAEVTRALGLPDDAVASALVPLAPAPPRSPGWRVDRGRVVPDVEVAAPAVPPRLAAALAAVREDLAGAPFAAPDAGRLRELALGPAEVALLARQGHLLRVGEGVVLLPGTDDRAVALLAELEQPFTTSRARAHLGTSRRVALPLLDHLDRTGRTVRLADDRRRLRG